MDSSNWVSVTVACVGAIIAYLQYRIKEQEHKFKLYEKRFPLYKALKGFQSNLHSDGRVNDEAYRQFFVEVRECYLLYGKQIRTGIDEIMKEAKLNGFYDRAFRQYPVGEERHEYVEKASQSFVKLDSMIEELVKEIEKATALDHKLIMPGCSDWLKSKLSRK